MNKGLFITLEGPEGAGKTTQIQRLSDLLATRDVGHIVTREPGGTDLADRIRALLLDGDNKSMHTRTEVLLMLAARSEHVENKILPALADGKVVLCDRFADSSMAYQGHGRGVDHEALTRMNEYATDGLVPDLTLLLDLPIKIGFGRVRSARGGLDRIEQAGRDFHEAVRTGFLAVARSEPERIKIIDASASANEVHERVAAEVTAIIRRTIRPDF